MHMWVATRLAAWIRLGSISLFVISLMPPVVRVILELVRTRIRPSVSIRVTEDLANSSGQASLPEIAAACRMLAASPARRFPQAQSKTRKLTTLSTTRWPTQALMP